MALRGNLFFSYAHFSKLQEVTHRHLLQQLIHTDLIVDMGTDGKHTRLMTWSGLLRFSETLPGRRSRKP